MEQALLPHADLKATHGSMNICALPPTLCAPLPAQSRRVRCDSIQQQQDLHLKSSELAWSERFRMEGSGRWPMLHCWRAEYLARGLRYSLDVSRISEFQASDGSSNCHLPGKQLMNPLSSRGPNAASTLSSRFLQMRLLIRKRLKLLCLFLVRAAITLGLGADWPTCAAAMQHSQAPAISHADSCFATSIMIICFHWKSPSTWAQ